MQKILEIKDFSGGLFNRFRQNRIGDSNAIAVRNARWNRIGALTKRNGSVRTAITLSGLGIINTIFAKEGSSTEELLMSDGDQVAVIGTSLTSPTSLITGLSNEWAPEFIYFGGAVYMTNGNDTVRKITTANSVSNIAAFPAARFAVAHKGYVFTFNQDGGGNRNRLQWSRSGDAETWDTEQFEDIQPFGNSAGLGMYSLGDELILFQGPNYSGSARSYNTGKMYRVIGDVFDQNNPTWFYEEIPLPPDVGLLGNGHRSIKAVRGVLYFATNNGVYRYIPGGGMPISVSEEIGGDIDNWEKADINTPLRMAAAAVWKNEYVLSLYNDGVSSDAYNNRIYTLDASGKWWVDTIDSGADDFTAGGGTGSCFAIFNGSLYGCSGSAALLRQWDVSGQSESNDSGTAGGVNFSFLTKEFDLGSIHNVSHIYVNFKRQSSGTLTFIHNTDQRGDVSFSIDMSAAEDGDVANSSSSVIRVKVAVGKPCRTIQLRAHDRGSNDCEIYGIEVWGEKAKLYD